MQLEAGNSLRAIDRSMAEGLTGPCARSQQRALVWAVLLATVVAAALGWAPLHGAIFGRLPAPAPAARDRTPLAIADLPLSAQGQLSGLLAEDRPAFRARQASGGYAMADARRALSARFMRSGVSIESQGLRVNMSLRSLSEGRFRAPIGAVAPTATANAVSYAHGPVREWYRNGPLGIEQGFDVQRPVGDHGPGLLVLAMSLGANAPASLSRDGRSLRFAAGSTSLNYDALVVSDAAGRILPSHLALARGELLIETDARHARFPLTIDPLIQQGGKLTATGEAEEGARFGTSAALSADGSTLLIGAPQADASRGAVWAFARSGGSWEQQGSEWTGQASGGAGAEECAEEEAEEAGECSFGASVALSADGNTALVGDPSSTTTAGVAWVFTRSGTAWSDKGEELPPGAEGGQARFGRSVALSADGDTALIGVPSARDGRGSASVFTRAPGGPWAQPAILSSSETHALAHFGRSVALSANGATALIGAPGDSNYVGAAWIFARHGATWQAQPGKLVGGGESENGHGHFAKSVALSGDGATALIGGRDDNGEQGAVWTFTRSGESFAQQGEKLAGVSEAASQFGYSVALSQDGSVALVGAPHEESGVGKVVELTRSGSGWTEVIPALGGSAASGKGATGASVALAENGEVAAIGAPRDAARAGAAWIFAFESPSQVPAPAVTQVTPGHGPAEGGTVVTINGSDFTREGGQEPAVMFGSTPATSVKLSSNSTLTATTPPGTGGAVVNVTVQTATGTSAISADDTFRYEKSEVPAKPAKGVAGGSSSATTTGMIGARTGVLGSTQAVGAACRVLLHSKRIVVASHRSAAIRLMRTGTGQCRGTLTLRYRQRTSGRHFKLRLIGSAHFSIAQGATQVVRVRLNKLGKTMLIAGHGKLNASAAVLRTTPAPRLAQTSSVRLSVKKKPKAATVAR